MRTANSVKSFMRYACHSQRKAREGIKDLLSDCAEVYFEAIRGRAGKITGEGFEAFVRRILPGTTKTASVILFAYFDRDEDGCIDLKELAEGLFLVQDFSFTDRSPNVKTERVSYGRKCEDKLREAMEEILCWRTQVECEKTKLYTRAGFNLWESFEAVSRGKDRISICDLTDFLSGGLKEETASEIAGEVFDLMMEKEDPDAGVGVRAFRKFVSPSIYRFQEVLGIDSEMYFNSLGNVRDEEQDEKEEEKVRVKEEGYGFDSMEDGGEKEQERVKEEIEKIFFLPDFVAREDAVRDENDPLGIFTSDRMNEGPDGDGGDVLEDKPLIERIGFGDTPDRDEYQEEEGQSLSEYYAVAPMKEGGGRRDIVMEEGERKEITKKLDFNLFESEVLSKDIEEQANNSETPLFGSGGIGLVRIELIEEESKPDKIVKIEPAELNTKNYETSGHIEVGYSGFAYTKLSPVSPRIAEKTYHTPSTAHGRSNTKEPLTPHSDHDEERRKNRTSRAYEESKREVYLHDVL